MKQQLRVSWFPDALQTLSFAARSRLSDETLNKLEDRGITLIKSDVHIRQLQHICIHHYLFFHVYDQSCGISFNNLSPSYLLAPYHWLVFGSGLCVFVC